MDAVQERQPVLVVDDELPIRKAMGRSFARRGFRVEGAENGPEALDKFGRETFGLVIADVRLPGMSGLEVLQEVRRRNRRVPVVMITAYPDDRDSKAALNEGASTILVKPFSTDALAASLTATGTLSAPCPWKPDPYSGAPFSDLLAAEDPHMEAVLTLARKIAPRETTVLIQGESGTGKELLARYIHTHSGRGHEPYVAVNCAALPESLAESELFGHARGAFTGAANSRAGRFELAGHGTLVLDEVSEMPLSIQAKLLRVLQERAVDPVGGTRQIPVPARVIAVSNVNLEEAVRQGRFRRDLFYRLAVLPITLPPLSARPRDILPLAQAFARRFSPGSSGSPVYSQAAEAALARYPWPGNVRELQNAVERAVILAEEDVIEPRHLFWQENPESLITACGKEEETGAGGILEIPVGSTLWDVERRVILATLESAGGNRTRTAEILGLSVRTLRNKLHEYREKKR
jgi:DNA-binding NtrC family response regulator